MRQDRLELSDSTCFLHNVHDDYTHYNRSSMKEGEIIPVEVMWNGSLDLVSRMERRDLGQ